MGGRGFPPRTFVHAKLLVAIAGRTAHVLAGSANLSRPALLRSTEGGGNVEAGVIVEGSASWAAELLSLEDGSEHGVSTCLTSRRSSSRGRRRSPAPRSASPRRSAGPMDASWSNRRTSSRLGYALQASTARGCSAMG